MKVEIDRLGCGKNSKKQMDSGKGRLGRMSTYVIN